MQTPSSLSVPYSLLPNWRWGLQAEQADRALISNMMDTEPSLPLCIRLPRSLPLQPRHVLGRYEPNHSLAKAATHPAPSSLPLPLHPSVFLVTVYAHPAPSPRVTLPPPSLWLFHAAIVSGVNTSCHTLHPRLVLVQPRTWCIPSTCTQEKKKERKKQASSARAAGRKSGRQVESWVIKIEEDSASLRKTKEFWNLPGLKIALGRE